MTLCNFVSKNIIAASQMKVENRATIPPVIAFSCRDDSSCWHPGSSAEDKDAIRGAIQKLRVRYF